MKKSLITFGTLLTLAVPVATVAACDSSNSKDNKGTSSTGGDSKSASSTGGNVYVQKHKDSEYPTMDQVLYDDLNTRAPNDFAYAFYKLKGKDYFKQYDSKVTQKQFGLNGGYWIGEYVQWNWTATKEGWVIMNWHELYDYANSQAPQFFPYN